MNRYKNVGGIFEDAPSQWGLRGDPHLWQELRPHLAATPMPADAQQLQSILEQAFHSLSGQPLATEEDCFFVDRYAAGGMSSGMVSPEFWRDTALPLLRERFAAAIVS